MRNLLTILLCVLVTFVNAQNEASNTSSNGVSSSMEKKKTFIAFGYGISNYLGDLGGNAGVGRKFLQDNTLKKRTSFYTFSLSHLRREAIGFRFSYAFGNIAGADHDAAFKTKGESSYARYKRNLDFQSTIKEWSLMAEVLPFKFFSFSSRLHCSAIQPYLLGGLGRFAFNPQGTYFDEIAADYIWIDLQPYRTEGQGMKEYPDRKPYKLTEVNVPFGFGIRYPLGRKTNLSAEFIGRKLFTDYLDDVSTNFIDPKYFDNYFEGEDNDIAKALHNKSNLIDPLSPYKPGDKRGNPRKYDFYYSFNISLVIQINKTAKKREVILPRWKFYKYDNMEICE